VVVLPQYHGDNVDCHRTMMMMDISVPPVLPDIKWVQLYSKWGQYIPQEVKKDLKYYVNKPPKKVRACPHY
jgi:hypothetical protein